MDYNIRRYFFYGFLAILILACLFEYKKLREEEEQSEDVDAETQYQESKMIIDEFGDDEYTEILVDEMMVRERENLVDKLNSIRKTKSLVFNQIRRNKQHFKTIDKKLEQQNQDIKSLKSQFVVEGPLPIRLARKSLRTDDKLEVRMQNIEYNHHKDKRELPHWYEAAKLYTTMEEKIEACLLNWTKTKNTNMQYKREILLNWKGTNRDISISISRASELLATMKREAQDRKEIPGLFTMNEEKISIVSVLILVAIIYRWRNNRLARDAQEEEPQLNTRHRRRTRRRQ